MQLYPAHRYSPGVIGLVWDECCVLLRDAARSLVCCRLEIRVSNVTDVMERPELREDVPAVVMMVSFAGGAKLGARSRGDRGKVREGETGG